MPFLSLSSGGLQAYPTMNLLTLADLHLSNIVQDIYTCIYGKVFGKRDLLAIFHVMKYDLKCGTCLHKFDCRETTLSNAANHLKIFLIEFAHEILFIFINIIVISTKFHESQIFHKIAHKFSFCPHIS